MEPVEGGDDDLTRPSGFRRIGRLLGLAGGSAALFGVLAVTVFPTSTYVDQRADTSEVEQRLDVLRAQNAAYQDRIERLETVEEIERLAREQYNLVFPGEEAYAVLPAPLPELDLPAVWPFGEMLAPDPAE
ncbi:MAG: septum formation initiator family protein [Acidimicrobiales bacterium]